MNDKTAPVCDKCGVSMIMKKTEFTYLGSTFSAEIHRCPKCGLAFIPEELVKGRIAEVEAMLEDK